MRKWICCLAFVLWGGLSAPLDAQVSREIEREYQLRVLAAEDTAAQARHMVLAAEGARFMRRFDEAWSYLASAISLEESAGDANDILRERLWLTLATGGGVSGVREAFSDELALRDMPPTVVAGWVNGFPELLVGGEFDALIDALAEDAEDPHYRCACYAPKAWRYRVADDKARSRTYWRALTVAWERVPDFSDPFVEADWRAQLARNLARAGDASGAHAELARAMAVDLSAFESGSIRRRRAQTYAELGEIDKAVEDLEYLLTIPSTVTVHTLESRMAWSEVRDHPSFQALLDRHR